MLNTSAHGTIVFALFRYCMDKPGIQHLTRARAKVRLKVQLAPYKELKSLDRRCRLAVYQVLFLPYRQVHQFPYIMRLYEPQNCFLR